MASYWHNIGNFDGEKQEWWAQLLSRGIVTAGYENSPGDTGDGKLQRYKAGDTIFAYASGYGALGYATVNPTSEYALVPAETRHDHRHQVTVEWKGHVERLKLAVGAERLRQEFGLIHPRSIATRIADEPARMLKEYFDRLSDGSGQPEGLHGIPAVEASNVVRSHAASFIVGRQYSREDIAEAIGLPERLRKGGPWATGYAAWDGQIFIFCNVGAAGRTGHDYPNRWWGETLIWSGKTNSTAVQPTICPYLTDFRTLGGTSRSGMMSDRGIRSVASSNAMATPPMDFLIPLIVSIPPGQANRDILGDRRQAFAFQKPQKTLIESELANGLRYEHEPIARRLCATKHQLLSIRFLLIDPDECVSG